MQREEAAAVALAEQVFERDADSRTKSNGNSTLLWNRGSERSSCDRVQRGQKNRTMAMTRQEPDQHDPVHLERRARKEVAGWEELVEGRRDGTADVVGGHG